MIRATSMGAALFQAALRVPAQNRPATIANQIIWRGENTKSGTCFERGMTMPITLPSKAKKA